MEKGRGFSSFNVAVVIKNHLRDHGIRKSWRWRSDNWDFILLPNREVSLIFCYALVVIIYGCYNYKMSVRLTVNLLPWDVVDKTGEAQSGQSLAT